ncbi:unnamed protein product [Cylicocyclus nassatus]|uniref:Uncharacterized protein n=1 Tax=Cylicocyclus nassatus TaxID=53992 RepID=A0AA36MIY1_CYLNA|nr:unnamed protein product [Cylicocyclus nassatus]CAJ0610717.1 unnamed protein product [Cylicocyclus nassatus]
MLRFGACVAPSGSVCCGVPVCAGSVKTGIITPDQSRPMTDRDFNKFTLNDIAFLRATRFSDPLHRSDLLAICTAILTIAGVLLMQSCSTTKATIMSARDAASTTITITTANPVSADTKVDANGTINPIK